MTIANNSNKISHTQIPLLNADARKLPFPLAFFEGIYCFELLHEFTSETKKEDIYQITSGIYRILKYNGILILAVLAGNPNNVLPHVQLFTEQMVSSQ